MAAGGQYDFQIWCTKKFQAVVNGEVDITIKATDVLESEDEDEETNKDKANQQKRCDLI